MTTRRNPTAIVVPCYDEAARLDPAALVELAKLAAATVVLVDDGSTDHTVTILESLVEAHPDHFDLLKSATNRGKGEAVRRGLRHALASGAVLVGYYDADLATPPSEMARLVDVLANRPDLEVVIGSRVGLLGYDIRRSMARHYLGRVFATGASVVLGLEVYDTQCGAKMFRATPALWAAVAEPFVSRWAFDVELLGRLHDGTTKLPGIQAPAFLEVPLVEWRDVDGTKLTLGSGLRALVDLLRIARCRRRRATRSVGRRGTSASGSRAVGG